MKQNSALWTVSLCSSNPVPIAEYTPDLCVLVTHLFYLRNLFYTGFPLAIARDAQF